MRRALHAVIILTGSALWVVAYFLIAACAGMAWAADRVWPGADMGNCFSYTLHRWCSRRGALVLTFVEDARLFRIFPVIHAAWTPGIHRRAEFEMTTPVDRKRSKWLPWWAFYFRYRVVKRDAETQPAPLGD